MKPIRWRLIVLSILTLVATYGIAPTLIYFSQPKEIRNDADAFQKKVPAWLPQEHIKLGLDLQGGVQLILGVDTKSAVENRLNSIAVEMARWAKDQGISVEKAYVPKGKAEVVIQLTSAKDEDIGKFKVAVKKEFPLLEANGHNAGALTYGYSKAEMERIGKSAVEQAERVVRSRVDKWGVAEPMIFRRADGTILVQLPGFKDPQRAKELLGRTAQLKFKIVDDHFTGLDALRDKIPAGIEVSENGGQIAFSSEDRDKLVAFLQPHIPQDHELLFHRQVLGDGVHAKNRWTSFVVHAATQITGEDIQDAMLAQGDSLDHRPAVALTFSGPGGRRFAEVTGANIKKRLAIILDDVVESAPVIQSKITGGRASISLGGGRSYNDIMEEGKQLSLILKSGAIPAEIKVLQQTEVGASLGPELANQGIKGILIGLFCVLLFMLLYYHRPGIIACIALILNAVFHLAIMAGFGLSFTLPGIAGFILTLGMAVDANVLINERIRQELREGRHPRKAVPVAFSKVFWTIIDANVTTLIAAFVLLETNSSGPIRGFAVTLIIGLLVSVFVALYGTRLLFDVAMTWIPERNLKAWLGVKNSDKKTRGIDFLRAGSISTMVIVALALSVIATTVFKGINFGVDFAGGTEMTIGFANDVEPAEIRHVAEESGLEGVNLQALEGGKKQYLLRYDASKKEKMQADGTAEIKAEDSHLFLSFKAALLEKLKTHGPEILKIDFVGPQVGSDLRSQGILSVLYAIMAVALYIAFRFDMRFAPSAFAKMILDTVVMFGFYAFFGITFDLVSVAAFLTVVGYSVNDTIVIYDRIRENLQLFPRRSLVENVNISVNETFGRSINTSVTTAVSLLGILLVAKGQVWDFAMALTIGIVTATVTSTLVASSFVVWFEQWRNSRLQKPMLPAKNT